MKNLNTLDWLALALIVIGGINWGFVGLLNINLVGSLFGTMSMVTQTVYALVGVAALYVVFILSTKTE